ncbi:hypothetical protein ABIF26_007449 [Bradyrhizobium elkanii]|uniref:hypothetical protein n=1 Tax=Bradyrhizobium elkanii TaxID=29448 RepID=UPI0035180818
MSKADLEAFLGFLMPLADGPHRKKVGKLKLLEERMKGYEAAARGWAYLAGAGGDDRLGDVELAVLSAVNRLMQYRRLPKGRHEGYISEHTKKQDAALEAEMKRGSSLRKAARKVGGEDQAETHRRRVQRRRHRVKGIVALQTK